MATHTGSCHSCINISSGWVKGGGCYGIDAIAEPMKREKAKCCQLNFNPVLKLSVTHYRSKVVDVNSPNLGLGGSKEDIAYTIAIH